LQNNLTPHPRQVTDLQPSEQRTLATAEAFTPQIRLFMTFTAQTLGFGLLFLLGFGIEFDITNTDIRHGFEFIRKVVWWYLGLTVLCCAVPLSISFIKRELTDRHVDAVLILLVVLDTILTLVLVAQEGGLCRSMFLPVFFLIPTAYLIVERREPIFRWRRLIVLITIVACICFSYRVSKEHEPFLNLSPNCAACMTPAQGVVRIWRWDVGKITDFETLSHAPYDKAMFYSSLISAFIPILQIFVEIVQDRFSKAKRLTATSTATSQSARI
jgi:hypothetical protein